MPESSKRSDLEIRPAQPGDEALILGFIRDLAEYEKLLHQVSADSASIHRYLFGERPVAECLIAHWQGQPAGFALFFHNFSTFLCQPGIYLEDLFVKPEFRGHGIGKSLLVRLAGLCRERDCGRLEWAVLDWNEPAIRFYRALGAQAMDDWIVNRVTGDALERLAALEQ